MKRKILHLFVALIAFIVGVDVYRISNHELLQLWVRQDNVKMLYGEQLYQEFSVHRSLSDNLFVTVTEYHPNGFSWTWHYLVRPKESTAEVAFQGELVDWRGNYASASLNQSNDKYVFSGSDDAPGHRLYVCESGGCPKVKVGNDYVEFPSVDYKENGVMIRVFW